MIKIIWINIKYNTTLTKVKFWNTSMVAVTLSVTHCFRRQSFSVTHE